MCGIIGYIGKHSVPQIIIDGLKRLEYRGYDSAGLGVLDSASQSIKIIKKAGRVENVAQSLHQLPTTAKIGIGHTRWATHGGVTDANAHPMLSSDGAFALIHNGVVENYKQIKSFLIKQGFSFSSETDTEALVNLIAYHYQKLGSSKTTDHFVESVRKSLLQVEGTYGIAVICKDFPDHIVGARKSSPLLIGVGEDENILASDASAFVTRTRNVVYLKDNEIALISDKDFKIFNNDKESIEAIIQKIEWEVESAELGDFQHYMQKEIFEQATAIENAMRGRFSDDGSTALFGGLNLSAQDLRQIDRIIFCACGTAYYACLAAEHMIERYARIPVEVEYASEFRYRNAPLDKNTLVFVISQSGETIDTLGALRESQRKGFRTLAIVNTVGSTIAREADGGIYQHAGPEIGVASTKAFTSQLVICALIALYMGRLRDLSFEEGCQIVQALRKLPEQVSEVLKQDQYIKGIAQKYAHFEHALYLGRQNMHAIALEGALKLKEISYIHAEGYAAGEMKHGPIALISEHCPCFILAPNAQDGVFQKTFSNLQEVRARKAPVVAIVSESSELPEECIDDIITIPDAHPIVQPILATLPVQLLAYHIAIARGCDVDKPRNLAKSVTVE